jgi:hypothetical protein
VSDVQAKHSILAQNRFSSAISASPRESNSPCGRDGLAPKSQNVL